MFIFRVFFYACLVLFCYHPPLTAAGGISLARSNMLMHKVAVEGVPKVMPREILRNNTKEMVMPIADDLKPRATEFDQIGVEFDPEYQGILDYFDERKLAFTHSHRDVQWQMVARSFDGITDIEERFELIEAVRKYPFWRPLPPTAALSPTILIYWLHAKENFLEELRNAAFDKQ